MVFRICVHTWRDIDFRPVCAACNRTVKTKTRYREINSCVWFFKTLGTLSPTPLQGAPSLDPSAAALSCGGKSFWFYSPSLLYFYLSSVPSRNVVSHNTLCFFLLEKEVGFGTMPRSLHSKIRFFLHAHSITYFVLSRRFSAASR